MAIKHKRSVKLKSISKVGVSRALISTAVFTSAAVGAVLVVSSLAVSVPIISEKNFKDQAGLTINLEDAISKEDLKATSYLQTGFKIIAIEIKAGQEAKINSPEIEIGNNYAACFRGITQTDTTSLEMSVNTADEVELSRSTLNIDSSLENDNQGCMAFQFVEGTGSTLEFKLKNVGNKSVLANSIIVYKLSNP